MAIKLVNKC